MILRTDGELSLLDLDHGNERRLLSGVEHFWLSNDQLKEESDPIIKEEPCWAYGPQGMQVSNSLLLSTVAITLDP